MNIYDNLLKPQRYKNSNLNLHWLGNFQRHGDHPLFDEGTLHHQLTRVSRGDLLRRYEVVEVIGNGSMGTVSIVHLKDNKAGEASSESIVPKRFFGLQFGRKKKFVHVSDRHELSSDNLYALKALNVDCCTDAFLDKLFTEVMILRSLDHPNIVKALEVYETTRLGTLKQLCFILELCTGGDLYTRLPYSQREAALIVSKVVSAVKYMHHYGVIHRDIKFENILFESKDSDADIKIIDFGLSKAIAHHKNPVQMTERVGTIYTMAPEVVQRNYSSQADMWSVGVVTYMLLSTSKPFYNKSLNVMMDLILDGRAKYDAPIWETIDQSAKDFVCGLLVVNPQDRMTAEAASTHVWLSNREILPEETPSEEMLNEIEHCLLQYRNTSSMKKIALNFVAHQSTSKEVKQLRKVFTQLDQQRNGVLTFEEFKTSLMRVLHYSRQEIDDLFSSLNINRNGRVMYTEFLAATIEAQGHIAEDQILEAFERLDRDGKGYITCNDLITTLGPHYSKHQVSEILKDADYDNDGKVSYREFLQNFREIPKKMTDDKRQSDISDAQTTSTCSDSVQGTIEL